VLLLLFNTTRAISGPLKGNWGARGVERADQTDLPKSIRPVPTVPDCMIQDAWPWVLRVCLLTRRGP